MGFFSKVGKGIGAGLSGIGKASMGTTEGIGRATMAIGREIGRGVTSNLSKSALAIGTGAIVGGILADADGNVSKGKTVAVGAGIGAVSTAIPGGAAVIGTAGLLGASAISTGLEGLGKVGEKMIKMPNKKLSLDNLDEVKLSKFGGVLLGGAALLGGIKEGFNYYEKSRMGANDGMLRTATPTVPIQRSQTPSYANNGGASGDLVFALNNLRNG